MTAALLASQSGANAVVLPVQDHLGLLSLFLTVVAVLLVLDLGLLHRRPHEIGWKAAAMGVGFWVVLALAFNLSLLVWMRGWLFENPSAWLDAWLAANPSALGDASVANLTDERRLALQELAADKAALDLGLQWLASYVVELSLSVDNLFVFVVVLRHFAVRPELQHRVLFWGILGAVLLRGLFIGLGVAVLHQFEWISAVFGGFLVLTGVRMLWSSFRHGEEPILDPSKTFGYRLLRRVMPLQPHFDGNRFFSRVDARLMATPLLAALVVIEFSDIVFAVDSVPAVLAITREPLIAFTSNIAAVLGLRAMYFLLANAVDRFHLLKPALGLVLLIVGTKMAYHLITGRQLVPVEVGLSIVLGIVALGVVLSLAFPKRAEPATP